jgi:hypothetical protein
MMWKLSEIEVWQVFQTIHSMPGICDRLRVAMRHQAEVRIQAGGAHMEHLLQGNVKS